MPRVDAGRATCAVYSRKEGVLRAVGHDLHLEVGEFWVEYEPATSRIAAEFKADSLRVVAAREGGADVPGRLSPRDIADIERHLREDVLDVSRHPSVRFTSEGVEVTPTGFQIVGTLELHGVARPLRVEASREGGRLTVRTRLHQPDFGITPFRAMLGALKIQPDVEVELAVPEDLAS